MAHISTVFSQIVRHLPWWKFQQFVKERDGDRKTRTFSCWRLFLCHLFAQVSGIASLRDLETTLSSKERRLYHLGLDRISKSTMADANEIADIYKARWDIELFFKWLKQNLKIKSFFGTSENAVRIQIWCALCVYLILAYLKYLSKSSFPLSKLLIRVRYNILDRVGLDQILHIDKVETQASNIYEQLCLTFDP